MSIVALKKVSIVALAAEKQTVLMELQRIGCMHLVPLTELPDIPGSLTTERPDD